MEVDSKKTASGFIWRLLERFGAQGVTFVVSIVLARILDPQVYGVVALITVFTSILQVFVDSGFGVALVQKKDSDDLDFSTVFWFNIFSCAFIYGGLFLLAPYISSFYNIDNLTPLIRVLGIVVLISGIKGVQQAYISRHFQFKKFFYATSVGTITAAVVGIYMAYKGFGVWALVIQNVVNQAVDTIMLWFLVEWKPKFMFSFSRFKTLFIYGWKFLVSGLIEQGYNELRSLIIGKRYTASDLAYYKKGELFPKMISEGTNFSIDSVLLPVMSKSQEDSSRIKAMTRRAIKVGSFITWPCMIGLAACSSALISLLLTDKWLFSVPYMVIFCFTYAFYPIHTANLTAIKAVGRSDIFLWLEIIKKGIGLLIILISMWFGVVWIAFGVFISGFFSLIINSWPNRKLLNYKLGEQMKDMLPSALLSIAMGFFVYCVNFIGLPNWLTLILQLPLGVIIYFLGAYLLKNESLDYCIAIFKALVFKRGSK